MATLVLLPGMDGTGDLFASFLSKLPDDQVTEVVRFPTHDPLSYLQLAEVAADQIAATGDVFLLGESFSGPLAVLLAAKLGKRVRGLVLCCTFVRRPNTLLSRFRLLAGVVPFEVLPRWGAMLLLLGRDASPELRGMLDRTLAKVSPSVLRKRLKEVATVDVSQVFASCRCPVLYLRATRDALVPAPSCELVVSLSPQAQVVVLSGAHCLLQTNPAGSAEAVARFIKDHENDA